MAIFRICAFAACGQSYKVTRYHEGSKYCSLTCACRDIAKRRAKPLVLFAQGRCRWCHKIFTIKHPRNPNVYCSRACQNAAHGANTVGSSNHHWKPKILLTCQTCGKIFEANPSKADDRKYCSKVCQSQHLHTLTGEARYNFKGAHKAMACVICGTTRMVRHSLQKRFRACSRRCAGEIARRNYPRISSLEIAMAEAFATLGLLAHGQYPIEFVTVDFAFPDAKLVVECDGTYWHGRPEQQRRDSKRDWFLHRRGWQVIRLTELLIRGDANACARHVRTVLRKRYLALLLTLLVEAQQRHMFR